jgi:hypothetical protein
VSDESKTLEARSFEASKYAHVALEFGHCPWSYAIVTEEKGTRPMISKLETMDEGFDYLRRTKFLCPAMGVLKIGIREWLQHLTYLGSCTSHTKRKSEMGQTLWTLRQGIILATHCCIKRKVDLLGYYHERRKHQYEIRL